MPLSKKAQKRGWKVAYEDNPGGLYFRHGEHGLQFVFVEVTDMDDACGRDNAGHPRYAWEARLLDLAQLGSTEISAAMACCGTKHEDLRDWEERWGKQAMFDRLAENCRSYRHGAPLAQGSHQRFEVALARAICEADSITSDADMLEGNLASPKNKIGTTGHDLLRGDPMAGLRRAAEEVASGQRQPTPRESILMRAHATCGGQTLGGATDESVALSELCAAALEQEGKA